MKGYSLKQHITHLSYFKTSVISSLHDLNLRKKGYVPKYNIDFSMLYPLLFNTVPSGSKKFKLDLKGMMNRILDMESCKGLYSLIISGPTYYEFLDQLEHIRHDLQVGIPNILNRYSKDIVKEDWLINSEQLLERLSIFSSDGYNKTIEKPVSLLRNYVNSGLISGIGDFFKSPSNSEMEKIKPVYDDLVSESKSYRLQQDREQRPDADSIFHYKMDAINVCLSLLYAMHNTEVPLFVTPTGLNIKNCDFGNIAWGRRPSVPLFLRNVASLKNNGAISSMSKYFIDADKMTTELLESLKKYNDIKQVPLYELTRLEMFYKIYFMSLHSVKDTNRDIFSPERLKEIRITIQNPNKVQDVLHSAVDAIKNGAKEIKEIEGVCDITYFDSLGLDLDPVVKRFYGNLGLKKGDCNGS